MGRGLNRMCVGLGRSVACVGLVGVKSLDVAYLFIGKSFLTVQRCIGNVGMVLIKSAAAQRSTHDTC